MTDKVQKIRAEIVRRIEEEQRINKEKEKLTGVGSIIDTRYESLLSFVDSMQEEPVSDDLEEAAKYYIPSESYHMIIESKGEGSGENVYDYIQMIDMFKAGANWQEQKDERNLNENALLYNARLEGIEIGKTEMKQQMMKEAKLYGWVARDGNGSLHLFEVEPSRIEDRGQWWDRDYNCTTLDKNDFSDLEWEDEPVYVKLIIIKEE